MTSHERRYSRPGIGRDRVQFPVPLKLRFCLNET